VADVSDEGIEERLVIRQEAALHIVAEKIAEDAAEVFVAGKAHKTAGVGEHADEPGKQPAGGEGVEVGFNALLLVEEPPPAAELDFFWGSSCPGNSR